MFRKMIHAALALALFMPSACAAFETKNNSLARNHPASAEGPRTIAYGQFAALLPLDNDSPIAGGYVNFSWSEVDSASGYRLEVEDMQGKAVLLATLPRNTKTHHVPAAKFDAPGNLRWRVVALDAARKLLAQTPWRILLPLSSECEVGETAKDAN